MSRLIMLVVIAASLFGCQRKPQQLAPLELTATLTPRAPELPVDTREWQDEDEGGFGAIETRSAAGDPGHLQLSAVRVEATQAGDYAQVLVEHHFSNDSTVPIEGTFRFPLPDGAIVTGLSMVNDGKTVEGEIVDGARARKIYQEIVDSMRDPAIMEWEHGSTFKMRVFPIEPQQEKIVTLRYLVPLRTRAGALVFVQGTRALDGASTLASLAVAWNGHAAFAEKNVTRGRRIEVAASAVPAVLSEVRGDTTYRAVRLTPDWRAIAANDAPVAKRYVVVVDTSRSALEERNLALSTLRAVLQGLAKDKKFSVAVSDLDTRLAPGGWQSLDADTIDAAVHFVESREPDGATDLGAMIQTLAAAAQGEPTAIIYLGDCEASWGEVDEAKLTAMASKTLAGVPFYPLLLGDSVDLELARSLAATTNGRMSRAQKARDVERFMASLEKRGKRLTRVALESIAGSSVLTDGASTLDEGESLLAFVRTDKGSPTPASLTLHASTNGKQYAMTVPVVDSPTPMVARRYGASLIADMQRNGRPKDEIVAASIEYTVLSKHTAFLVLDSEEAYQRYNIERRAKAANEPSPPQVDGLDPESANISADRIQPGDPEIEIDAPRDAERVFVVLPNGDLKVATYDEDANHGRGAWMVRFLVENGTPEGTYEARVFIELADGRSETRTVSYVVDTTAPRLAAHVRSLRGGAFEIEVTQRGPRGRVDLTRVEVLTPDGQSLTLGAIRWGDFRGRWTPTRAITGEELHIVGVDQALNRSTLEVNVP